MASSNSLLVFTALLGIILILSLEVVLARELLKQTEENVVEAGYEEQKASTSVNYGYSYQPIPTNGYYNGFQPKENVDKAGYEGQKALAPVGLRGGNYYGYNYVSAPVYGPYGPNSGVKLAMPAIPAIPGVLAVAAIPARPAILRYGVIVPYSGVQSSISVYGPYGPNSDVQPASNYPGVIYSSSFYNSYPYVIGYGGQP